MKVGGDSFIGLNLLCKSGTGPTYETYWQVRPSGEGPLFSFCTRRIIRRIMESLIQSPFPVPGPACRFYIHRQVSPATMLRRETQHDLFDESRAPELACQRFTTAQITFKIVYRHDSAVAKFNPGSLHMYPAFQSPQADGIDFTIDLDDRHA